MKKSNQINNLTAEKSKALTDESLFGDNAEQTAQQVVPLAQTVYSNAAPTVSMQARSRRFNPFLLVSLFALATLAALGIFYLSSNRQVKSASSQTALEENKIDPVVVNVPQTQKVEAATLPAPVNNKKREKTVSRQVSDQPVAISEETVSDETESDKEETGDDQLPPPPPLQKRAIKDKKGERFLRRAERAQEKLKELKEIYDDLSDN